MRPQEKIMNIVNSWEWQKNNMLVFRPWLDEGITHGFSGIIPMKVDSWSMAEYHRVFSSWYPKASLSISRQVHGSSILEIPNDLEIPKDTPTEDSFFIVGEGDAVIASRTYANATLNSKRALAVQTADCAPILIITELDVAVVHAGWRGLASGIIQKTVQQLLNRGGNQFRALIGPAATAKLYEVGTEVIENIGPTAKAIKKNDTHWFLDIGHTALHQFVLASGRKGECHLANVCTIEDLRFYSYRRATTHNAALEGRNVSFVFC